MRWVIDARYADGSELHTTCNASFDKDKWTDENLERMAMQIWIAGQSDYDCLWYSLELEEE